MDSIYFPAAASILIIILTALCAAISLLYRKCSLENARLSERLKAAAESNKRNSEFFTNMTHELKTPLSVILGAIQLIDIQKRGNPEEESGISKNLKIIRINCYRLLRLTNNLLDLAKVEAGYSKFRPVTCSLDNILSEIVNSVMPYAHQKQISLNFSKPSEMIITAIDIEKMERIMLNLLSNAIKFTPIGGIINVSVYMAEGRVCISVKDSGAGIPPEYQEQVFSRFRQLGGGISSEGSGIGLSLVKSYVGLHHGDIKIVSEQNKGCEFIIELPIICADEMLDEYKIDELNMKMAEAAKIEFSAMNSAAL